MNTKVRFITEEDLPADINLIAELKLLNDHDSCKIYFTSFYYCYYVNFWVGFNNSECSKFFACKNMDECLALINEMTDENQKGSIISLGNLNNKRWWSYLPNWMFLYPEITKQNFARKVRKYILEFKNNIPEKDLSKTEKITLNHWIDHIGLNIPKYIIPKAFFPEIRQQAS